MLHDKFEFFFMCDSFTWFLLLRLPSSPMISCRIWISSFKAFRSDDRLSSIMVSRSPSVARSTSLLIPFRIIDERRGQTLTCWSIFLRWMYETQLYGHFSSTWPHVNRWSWMNDNSDSFNLTHLSCLNGIERKIIVEPNIKKSEPNDLITVHLYKCRNGLFVYI